MKQKNIPWLGAFVEALYNSLPFLSIINFLSIITVLYATLFPYLKVYIPWMTIWIFLGTLLILTSFTMFLVYKFVLPSIWTFRGKQMFGYDTTKLGMEIIRKLDDILKELKHENRNNSSN